MIAYGSKTLKGAELNWNTTEKELYSIFTFVKKFKHYLGGRKFIVQSDHHALKYISALRDSTGKITRMLNYLQGFDFEIHHISGKLMEQIGPDVLSRSMLPLDKQPQDIIEHKLERPVLKLYHGSSPLLSSWFSIEPPKLSYFDSSGDLIIDKQTLGYENPTKADKVVKRSGEDKLYSNLKQIIKRGDNRRDRNKDEALKVESLIALTLLHPSNPNQSQLLHQHLGLRFFLIQYFN